MQRKNWKNQIKKNVVVQHYEQFIKKKIQIYTNRKYKFVQIENTN